jgi:hypothetical protein
MQVDGISMMSLPRKHSHSVMKDVTSTLHTLIQPRRSMTLLVDWDRKGLATTVIHCINDRNIELLRMLRQMMSTRHSYCAASAFALHHRYPSQNAPAAPAPTTNTFFLFTLLLFPFVSAIFEMGKRGSSLRIRFPVQPAGLRHSSSAAWIASHQALFVCSIHDMIYSKSCVMKIQRWLMRVDARGIVHVIRSSLIDLGERWGRHRLLRSLW